ncbi:Anthranilate phosphoribosyltransferase [Diplonema papillatum]|nr:Anthranilate phosphoribosyltransferase [Diplonema papillatum]
MAAMQTALKKLVAAPDADGFETLLTADERRKVIEELLEASADATLKAAVLTLLACKGESASMVDDFSTVLLEKATHCALPDCCDIVGTGGDGKNTLNISTPASLIAAAMGLTVAKHGNRSASSNSGSADVIEHLGACLTLTPEQVEAVASKTRYAFIFAPCFHPSLKCLAPIRKQLGIKTVFNIVGPLLNPAGPRFMLAGVGKRDKVDLIVSAFERKSKHTALKVLVVHSEDGLDKISPVVPTHSWLVESGQVTKYTLLKPADFGLAPSAEDTTGMLYYEGGGSPVENAAMILSVLDGGRGVVADFVCVQAAALAHVAGKGTLGECMQLARAAVRDGAARKLVDDYASASTQVAKDRSTDILARIIKRRAVDVHLARLRLPFESLEARVRDGALAATLNLAAIFDAHAALGKVGICAELKRASPSEGHIASSDLVALGKAYATAGVQVISVLTEPVWFQGSLDVMQNVRQAVDSVAKRPAILRKDFIFSKYQVLEARQHGADSLLLIVAAMGAMEEHGESLKGLIEYSRKWDMEPLVEVVSEEEVDTALSAGAKVIGVNNRDLKTFKVDLNRTGALKRYAETKHPPSALKGVHWLALSGISTSEHVQAVKNLKASGVLVGTSLMRSDDPAKMISTWQSL